MENNIEETLGYKVAIGFKPFIDPRSKEHMEIVKDMAKSINGAIERSKTASNLPIRVKQLLTSFDYGQLSDYQAKCVLLVERELASLKQ